VITPDDSSERPRPRVDGALVKALARAHRWQRLLESGECGSITELAAAEKIDRSYLRRVLRLTLLASVLVEAILDGRQAEVTTLPALMKGFPAEWRAQRFCFNADVTPCFSSMSCRTPDHRRRTGMKRNRFIEEQIIGVLWEQEAGVTVADLTKECLAAVPDTSLSGKRIVREMSALIAARGTTTADTNAIDAAA
jgi:hypothetical protein